MLELETMNEINEYVKEYLSYHGMSSTLEKFNMEVKSKQMAKRLRKDQDL